MIVMLLPSSDFFSSKPSPLISGLALVFVTCTLVAFVTTRHVAAAGPKLEELISIEYTQDVSLGQIFEDLSRRSGMEFACDPILANQRSRPMMTQVTIFEAAETIAKMNGLMLRRRPNSVGSYRFVALSSPDGKGGISMVTTRRIEVGWGRASLIASLCANDNARVEQDPMGGTITVAAPFESEVDAAATCVALWDRVLAYLDEER